MNKFILTGILLTLAAPATAADWVLGLGYTDFNNMDATDELVVEAEVHADPFGSLGRFDFSLGGAVVVHGNGDYWVGGGISTIAPLRNDWFVEASVMPGYYDAADVASDLGGEFEIRSLIGIGRQFGESNRLSLALSHKSNANTGTDNPGVNALSLRLRRGF